MRRLGVPIVRLHQAENFIPSASCRAFCHADDVGADDEDEGVYRVSIKLKPSLPKHVFVRFLLLIKDDDDKDDDDDDDGGGGGGGEDDVDNDDVAER